MVEVRVVKIVSIIDVLQILACVIVTDDYFLCNSYLKISSIFLRPSFPIIKKAPAPNNTVGIAKYSISDIGSPHIPSITITSISNISQ